MVHCCQLNYSYCRYWTENNQNKIFSFTFSSAYTNYIARRRPISEFYKSRIFTKAFNTLLTKQNPFGFYSDSANYTALDDSHGFCFYDLNAKLSLTPSPGQEISLSLYSSFDDLSTFQDIQESYFFDDNKWGMMMMVVEYRVIVF